MARVTKLQAIAQMRCPRCRKGKMFEASVFDLTRFGKMNKRCPNCNLFFEIEPGFFWGAMYFSYVLNISEVVPIGVLTYLILNDPGPWAIVGVLLTVILLLTPFNFRMARVLMLYLVAPIKYDPSFDK